MRKQTFAFTLIELLVVISIMGVLATLIVANLNSARNRARDTQRKSDLRNIQTAIRLYYNDKGGYPTAGTLVWGGPWDPYMNKIPAEPVPGWDIYVYVPDAVNDTYTLSACLENKSDDKCDSPLVGCSNDSGCLYTVRP